MTTATRSFWKALLNGLAWILLAIAGLAFWVGGRAISEFGKIDRIFSEMLGLGIAFATGALGYILKTMADDLSAKPSADAVPQVDADEALAQDVPSIACGT